MKSSDGFRILIQQTGGPALQCWPVLMRAFQVGSCQRKLLGGDQTQPGGCGGVLMKTIRGQQQVQSGAEAGLADTNTACSGRAEKRAVRSLP